MNRVWLTTALALFALAPSSGSACEYYNASAAAATPPAQLALAAEPAATKVPAAAVVKAPASKTTPKQVSAKTKAPAPETKVVVSSAN